MAEWITRPTFWWACHLAGATPERHQTTSWCALGGDFGSDLAMTDSLMPATQFAHAGHPELAGPLSPYYPAALHRNTQHTINSLFQHMLLIYHHDGCYYVALFVYLRRISKSN